MPGQVRAEWGCRAVGFAVQAGLLSLLEERRRGEHPIPCQARFSILWLDLLQPTLLRCMRKLTCSSKTLNLPTRSISHSFHQTERMEPQQFAMAYFENDFGHLD